MKRNALLKILNPILAILLLNQALTGLLSDSLSGEAFEVLHEGGGVAFVIGGLLHLVLNWNWVKANFFKHSPTARG